MRSVVSSSDKQSGDAVSQQGAAASLLDLGPPGRLFGLNQTSGQLSIRDGVPPGSYRLQVRVSDHTWPDVTSTVRVDVRELQQDALENAASVRLNSESRRTSVPASCPVLPVSSAHPAVFVQI